MFEDVKKIKVEEKIRILTEENKVLRSKIETAKSELIRLEVSHGKKQYQIPNKISVVPSVIAEVSTPPKVEKEPVEKKERKEKDGAKKAKPKASESAVESIVDVRKLDLRIGKIVDVNKHADADSLYVEKIDVGETNPRTIVSGLVNHVPIEEMQGRMVMVLCNLKPVKMRGVTSEGMVMCASTPDKVEVLIPPAGAVPGDLVSCEGYPREPEPVMNPKKKIFETCAPDLKTNEEKVACYKNSPLIVPDKGPVVASTLKGAPVK
ncbi:hypothetical protein O3G_MSEX008153 [Manduca sexta]|uniref:tRNA-binding domain-containing protein n=1 Tax=Manduca sexta TaxID=7130 RepID=A0A921ZAY6_MANSE|nr:hypothetical protein O3G_MSEX008153 [Manduca sexta]